MRVSNHSSALDGYQSNDPKRAYMLTASIYAAIAGLGVHYAQPPASFEKNGQKIRRPNSIVDNGLATCLDTSVLFAAALEAAGLNSVVVMLHGHAIAAVWLVKRTLPKTQETDITELRKAIAARELIALRQRASRTVRRSPFNRRSSSARRSSATNRHNASSARSM